MGNKIRSLATDALKTMRKLELELTAELKRLGQEHQNPAVTPLGKNCFVLRSSELKASWLPAYHDFRIQYQRLLEEVQKARAKRANYVLNKLNIAARKGWYESSTRNSIRLHPLVQAKLVELLGLERKHGRKRKRAGKRCD